MRDLFLWINGIRRHGGLRSTLSVTVLQGVAWFRRSPRRHRSRERRFSKEQGRDSATFGCGFDSRRLHHSSFLDLGSQINSTGSILSFDRDRLFEMLSGFVGDRENIGAERICPRRCWFEERYAGGLGELFCRRSVGAIQVSRG